jgi:predicted ATPase with chaperone activity
MKRARRHLQVQTMACHRSDEWSLRGVPILRALLTARAALTLARTIADLAGAEMIAALHLAEALQYRSRTG